MKFCRILLGSMLSLHCLLSGSVSAQVVTEFSSGITGGAAPVNITAGPDGNLWFTDLSGNRIVRITPLGVVAEISAGIAGGFPSGITAGPDGNLWFAKQSDLIGRITPLGVVTEFSAGITVNAQPVGITAGPDGNLWFTEYNGNRIGRITPLGIVTEFSISVTAGPVAITAGPDGNLWFTEYHGNRIGRITPLGFVTEFSAGITAGAGPASIVAGPDGNLWFTEYDGNRIGRITPLGVVTEFSTGITGGAGPAGITAGPDGNLWFTESSGKQIGRITPLGVITEFSTGITDGAWLAGITGGPDSNLWFTEYVGKRIGRITTGAVIAAPVFASAVSRKVHGSAGTFDLALSAVATNPTTEPRQGPAQTIVLTFNKAITGATVAITEGAATVAAPTFSGNNVIVGLTSVNNEQYVTISLTNVASSDGGSGGTGFARIGFLAGDASQNRVVTVSDVGAVNAALAQPVTASNYLKDLNASGTLTIADQAIASANLSKALPAP